MRKMMIEREEKERSRIKSGLMDEAQTEQRCQDMVKEMDRGNVSHLSVCEYVKGETEGN